MNLFTKIASVIFGLMALLHLLRLTFFHVEITVDGCHVPIWISIIGFLVTATLCIGLWREAKKRM